LWKYLNFMNIINTNEPFVRMYELKGLDARKRLFVCKVWSFQVNDQECYLSNDSWAQFLGCSRATVNRIKSDLKKLKIIETDRSYVHLLINMKDLINILNQNYPQRSDRSKEKLPFWAREASQNDTKSTQIEDENNQIAKATTQNEDRTDQIEQKSSQTDNQLNNIKEIDKRNEKNNELVGSLWMLSSFEDLNITSTSQINLQSSNIERRNQLLSFWYKNISEIKLLQSSLKFFNHENCFQVLYRILCRVEEGIIKQVYLNNVDINYFLMFIYVIIQDNETSLENDGVINLRDVANDIQNHINSEKEHFKLTLMPDQNER
jgi:hypothetical protein